METAQSAQTGVTLFQEYNFRRWENAKLHKLQQIDKGKSDSPKI